MASDATKRPLQRASDDGPCRRRIVGLRMPRLSRAGLAGAVLHLAILGCTVALILSGREPNWPGYWIAFLALDFPVSLGVMPVTWLVPASSSGPLRDISNFWWPLVYHGVLGTAWWYIVGRTIGTRIARALARGHRER